MLLSGNERILQIVPSGEALYRCEKSLEDFLKLPDLHHRLALAHWRGGDDVHNDPVVGRDGFLEDSSKQTYHTTFENGWIRYANKQTDASTLFRFEDNTIVIKSVAAGGYAAEPFVLKFRFRGIHPAHATLLGVMEDDGSVRLPAVLHIPGQGTLRITAESAGQTPLRLGYQGTGEHGAITFPAGSEENPWIQFRLEVVSLYPKQAEIEGDARFDSYRRCWLNILQLSCKHRVLANHAGSEVCGLCYHALQ